MKELWHSQEQREAGGEQQRIKDNENKKPEKYFLSEILCGYQPPKKQSGTLTREEQDILSHCHCSK